eukprot:5518808-Pyramimonas_sp.AAC.1
MSSTHSLCRPPPSAQSTLEVVAVLRRFCHLALSYVDSEFPCAWGAGGFARLLGLSGAAASGQCQSLCSPPP